MPLTYLLIGKKIGKLEKPSGNQADKHIIVRSCVIIVAVLTCTIHVGIENIH